MRKLCSSRRSLEAEVSHDDAKMIVVRDLYDFTMLYVQPARDADSEMRAKPRKAL